MRLEITKEWTQLLVFSDVESKSNVSWIWKTTSLIRRNNIITSYIYDFIFKDLKFDITLYFFFISFCKISFIKLAWSLTTWILLLLFNLFKNFFVCFYFIFQLFVRFFCCWLMVFFYYYLATVKSQKKGSNSCVFFIDCDVFFLK